MSRTLFNRFSSDLFLEIQGNKHRHALYDFLAFLMKVESTPNLKVVALRDGWKHRIKEITFQFGEESPQSIQLKELSVSDYEAYLSKPDLLLTYFEADKEMRAARNTYAQVQQAHQEFNDAYLNWKNNKQSRSAVLRMELERFDFQQMKFAENEALKGGALFNIRLTGLFKEYAKQQGVSAPVLHHQSVDHIEVELLTILEDPDISDRTKSDAKETLEVYRQENVTVKRNPKEENALLAIQTIRQHYTKGGSWT